MSATEFNPQPGTEPLGTELSPAAPVCPFLVVGIGASAGGLEAFKEFLDNLPSQPGMAFLYVQHLEPNRPSLLQDILSRATPLTVREALDGMKLEPNHVYVIPHGADMAVKDGSLSLSPRPSQRGVHMPVDHLFRSLAENQKSRAIGVILSGGGTDGTLGFQTIKAEGGITFAQDEKTAKQHSMPRSAVADGNVDYVFPPGDIARKLVQLAEHPYTCQPELSDPADHDGAVHGIMTLLRSNTDVDFSQYKRTTILRRIRRRMALRGLDSFRDYQQQLQGDPEEVQNLYQDFLIRVTRFFRDQEVFEALKQTVFPALVENRSPNASIRIWVAGCSTGEEVYSLAISLLEFLGDWNSNCSVKFLATDINEAALEKARAGVYIDNIEMDVSADRLRRFFAKVNGQHYQIGKVVRDLCVFSKHNLTNDPPFSRLDLISCRNVLIYLNTALQKRVLPILHYALNPAGFLVLGPAEAIGNLTDLFDVRDPKNRIYSKNAASVSSLGLDFNAYLETAAGGGRPVVFPTGHAAWSAMDVQKEADRVLLARYSPVGVVVDENMTVLQFRGHTGPFLEPAPGMASLDLLKMLRGGLLGEVRTVIGRARSENAAVRVERVALRENDRMREVRIEVVPIRVPPSGARCFLVLFEDLTAGSTPAPDYQTSPELEHTEAERQVVHLQQELTATREYLQSLVEEHEAACEELKSASEELLSANEELQSTNEELQTAKEETQSANEELATLNDELHHRNLDLAKANNDLINLLGGVNIPIVLVNRDLRIRRFTPVAEHILNLIPTDVGRPIGDIKPNINVPDLGALSAKVIDTLTPLERDCQDDKGHWHSLRIRPYITLDNKIDGASITLLDIDNVRRNPEQRG